MQTSNANNNNVDTSNKKTPWRDMIGFFILGILSDALPGFFFTSTVIESLDIPPEAGGATLQLSADVGGVAGVFFTSFVLNRFLPEFRALVNISLQIVGIVLSWQLPYPYNMVGINLLTIGFVGILTIMLPLTSYKPAVTLATYQFGYSLAPIFGAVIVNIGDAVDMQKDGLFAIATCWPFIVCAAFFLVIDRSPWRAENAGFFNLVSKSNKDESSLEKSEEEDDDNTTTKTNNSLGDIELAKISENQAEKGQEAEEDAMNEDEEEENGDKAEISKFESAPLHRADMVTAVKAIIVKYWSVIFFACATRIAWGNALEFFYLGSLATYNGNIPAEDTVDLIILVGHILVLVVGVSIVTPYIGNFLGTRSVYWLWIPAAIQAGLVIFAAMGLAGRYEPHSIGTGYAVQGFIMMMAYWVQLYVPINLRNDKNLDTAHTEFQLQTILVVQNVTYLLMDFITLFWLSPKMYGVCQDNLEDVYTGVQCQP